MGALRLLSLRFSSISTAPCSLGSSALYLDRSEPCRQDRPGTTSGTGTQHGVDGCNVTDHMYALLRDDEGTEDHQAQGAP